MSEIVKVKNLAQLKRTVKPGMKIENINHLHNEDKTRKILKVNTVSVISQEYLFESAKDDIKFYKDFDMLFHDEQGKNYIEYYTYFEKAKYLRFNQDGSIDFLAHEQIYRNPNRVLMEPDNSFKPGQVWLTIKIFK